MIEIEADHPEFYLNPGEVYVARSPSILKTVLAKPCVGIHVLDTAPRGGRTVSRHIACRMSEKAYMARKRLPLCRLRDLGFSKAI